MKDDCMRLDCVKDGRMKADLVRSAAEHLSADQYRICAVSGRESTSALSPRTVNF